MVELAGVVLGGLACVLVLWFGYRGVTAARLYWTLSGTAPDTPASPGDGETAAIKGEVSVEEPAPEGRRVVEGVDSPVAAYAWRAAFPKAGQNRIDFETRETEQAKSTFASGIESGTFHVVQDGTAVRVDPEWLAETHGSTQLSEVTVGGLSKSDTFSNYLWDSPYLHLTGHTHELSLDRLRCVVGRHDTDVDLGRYTFESAAVTADTTLAVRGELRIDRGEPVIRGTDDTPLVISDDGFDGLRRSLGRQAAKNAVIVAAILALAVFFLGG